MRILALDVAKGVGILLVVFGHVWRGAFDAGLAISEGMYRLIDNAIYAFHMPLFFFLSALLFVSALRRPVGALLIDRVMRLLWPMVIWTWIFFGTKVVVGDLQNTPTSLSDFPVIPLPPHAHFWFLWALFLIQVALILLLQPLSAAHLRSRGFRLAMGGAALALGFAMPWIELPSLLFGAAVHYFPFFLAGLACAGLVRVRPPLWVAPLALIAAVVLIGRAAVPYPPLPLTMVILLLLWLAITAVCAAAGDRPGAALAWLALLGGLSMPIYLAHTIFSAGLREVLISGGITNLPLHLIAAMAIGIIGPVILSHAAARLRLARVLGF